MTVVYSNGFEQGSLGDWNHVTVTASTTGAVSTWINGVKQHSSKDDFIPVRVIYNPPLTICIFPDGEKVIVRCADDEEYVKEVGVMACITKKVMSRAKFKKLVEAGYEQPQYKELPKNIKSGFPTKLSLDVQSADETLKRIKEILKEELEKSKKYKKDQWG
jgi:hypothetical protein